MLCSPPHLQLGYVVCHIIFTSYLRRSPCAQAIGKVFQTSNTVGSGLFCGSTMELRLGDCGFTPKRLSEGLHRTSLSSSSQ